MFFCVSGIVSTVDWIWCLNCLELRRHQQYIGKVKHAVFHTQKAARKRVVVSTEENVVASLDLRHGEICELLYAEF